MDYKLINVSVNAIIRSFIQHTYARSNEEFIQVLLKGVSNSDVDGISVELANLGLDHEYYYATDDEDATVLVYL